MKIVKLKDVAIITTGKTPSKATDIYYSGGTIPFVKPPNLIGSDEIITTEEYLTFDGAKHANIIPKHSIMVSCIGSLGKVGIAGSDLVTNQQINSLTFNPDLVDYKYGYYFSLTFARKLKKIANSAVVPIVNKTTFSNLDFILHTPEEQRKIVNILDNAELLLKKRKTNQSLLDSYLKSMFLEMFGDPINNTKNWNVVELGRILSSMTSGSRGWAKFYANEGNIFLTIKNVGRNNKLLLNDITYVNPPDNAEARRTKVREGDILLSITADLGRTAVVPKLSTDAFINQHLAILRLKDGVDPSYVSHYLSTVGGQYQIQRLNKGASKAGLNFNDVRSIKVPLPPIELQERFTKVLRHSQLLTQRMGEQSELLDTQFQSLIQRSFQ